MQIGLICSEKQAIDATLRSLAREDPRFCPVADRYWNARGGSHTDGGAFIFTVAEENGAQDAHLHRQVRASRSRSRRRGCAATSPMHRAAAARTSGRSRARRGQRLLAQGDVGGLYQRGGADLPAWTPGELRGFCDAVVRGGGQRRRARRRPSKPSPCCTTAATTRATSGARSVLQLLDDIAGAPLRRTRRSSASAPAGGYRRIDWETRAQLAAARAAAKRSWSSTPSSFPPEGEECDARAAARGLRAGLAALHRLPLPRPALHRLRPRARTPTACASTSTAAPATTWPPASTGWRSTSTATPRTSSARS